MLEDKVSVIVPVYNVEKYLEKCIESISSQTYSNIEIILIDDGSEDNSGEICDKFIEIDKRIIVKHKCNEGVSAARNDGIDIANGKYICFVDGDDYIAQDYVEYLVNLINKFDTPIALTFGFFTSYDQKQIKNDDMRTVSGEEATEALLCYQIPIGVYCKIFKKSFIDDNNLRFRTDLFIGEGFNFNASSFQLAFSVGIGYKKIYYYRLDNPTSATTKFSEKKWINGLYSTKEIKKNFIKETDKLELAWKYAWWHTNADVYNLLIISEEKNKYIDMYKKSLEIVKKDYKYAFKVQCTRKEKIKALIYKICPILIPKLKVLRKRIVLKI